MLETFIITIGIGLEEPVKVPNYLIPVAKFNEIFELAKQRYCSPQQQCFEISSNILLDEDEQEYIHKSENLKLKQLARTAKTTY